MRAADTALPGSSARDGEVSGLSSGLPDNAPELRILLLEWWELNGRRAIPRTLHPEGSRSADGEELDPCGVVLDEVRRAAGQHSRRECILAGTCQGGGSWCPALHGLRLDRAIPVWPRLVVRFRPSGRS